MNETSYPSKVKLRDVAREAGVSVATVSRVLNESPSVNRKTRERIESLIGAMGYAPNPVAKALSKGRTRAVGAIIPTVNHAIFAAFIEGLEGGLDANGYSLVIATSSNDKDLEFKRARSLLEMGAEALILSGAAHADGLEDLAQRFRAPVILTSIFDAASHLPTIGYNNRRLARAAMKHLVELGHRRIAVLHGPTDNNDRARFRLEGARAFQDQCELSFWETELSEGGGAEATQRLLLSSRQPTAILCLSDVLALGAMFEIQRRGLRIPDDLSVMGFDDIAWSAHANPPLTCISLPAAEMGRATAQAIARHLEFSDEICSLQLDGELKVRASTRAL